MVHDRVVSKTVRAIERFIDPHEVLRSARVEDDVRATSRLVEPCLGGPTLRGSH